VLSTDARPVWCEVSLDAITANLATVRRLASRPVKVIATVKANAYGHGAPGVGLHLQALGVNALATANLDDAVAMRDAGVTIPIVMFASNLPEGLGTLVAHQLTPTVQDLTTAEAIARLAGRRRISVHVKVDAGLGRLGVKLSEARGFVNRLVRMPGITVEGLYTHLPFSDPAQAQWAQRRLEAFTSVVEALQREDGIGIDYAQAAASSILAMRLPDTLNTVAPGHLLFGLNPVSNDVRLAPALRGIKARLIHISHHIADEDVGGYGAARSPRTGVFLLGTDNGYRVTDAWVLCRGQRCKVLSVTTEYTVIDLAPVPNSEVGDEVTVVGEGLPLQEVAGYLGLTPMLAAISFRRIPISYINGQTSAS